LFYKHNNDVYLSYSELCMKINYLAIILVFGWSWLVEGVSFDRLTILDRERELARVQICDNNLNSNNLVTIEQILNSLWGFNYTDLISMALPVKNELIDQFKVRFCKSMNDTRRLRWSEYTALISDFNNYTQQLKSALLKGEPNLVALEYLLKLPYDLLINLTLGVKWEALVTNLNNDKPAGASVCIPTSTIIGAGAPVGAGAPAVSAACLPVVLPVAGARAFDPRQEVVENIVGMFTKINPLLAVHSFRPKFMGSVGAKERLVGGLNAVNMKSYPLIGKYFNDSVKYHTSLSDNADGSMVYYEVDNYVLADPKIIIENDYIAALAHIPANIRTALDSKHISPERVEFYTQLAFWYGGVVPFSAAPANQAGMDNGFNLLFHGALADWYLALTWDFATQNVAKSLPMGLFNSNGIIAGGDLPIDRLISLPVNPHQYAYSPPNATFKVAPARNIVSFWSVAVSADRDDPLGGKRAIVTYHLLINQAPYEEPEEENFLQNITDACYADTPNTLLGQLKAIDLDLISSVEGNPDRVAWRASLDFMASLYEGI